MIDAQSGARRPHQPSDCQGIVWAWLGASPAIGFGHSNAGEGEGSGAKGKGRPRWRWRSDSAAPVHLPQLSAEGQEHFLLTVTMTHSPLSPAAQASSSRQEEPSPASKAWGLAWTALGRCLGPYSVLPLAIRGSARTSSSMPACQVSVTAPLPPRAHPPPSSKTIIFPSHEVSCFSLHFFGFLFSQATQFQHTVRHQDCR